MTVGLPQAHCGRLLNHPGFCISDKPCLLKYIESFCLSQPYFFAYCPEKAWLPQTRRLEIFLKARLQSDTKTEGKRNRVSRASVSTSRPLLGAGQTAVPHQIRFKIHKTLRSTSERQQQQAILQDPDDIKNRTRWHRTRRSLCHERRHAETFSTFNDTLRTPTARKRQQCDPQSTPATNGIQATLTIEKVMWGTTGRLGGKIQLQSFDRVTCVPAALEADPCRFVDAVETPLGLPYTMFDAWRTRAPAPPPWMFLHRMTEIGRRRNEERRRSRPFYAHRTEDGRTRPTANGTYLPPQSHGGGGRRRRRLGNPFRAGERRRWKHGPSGAMSAACSFVPVVSAVRWFRSITWKQVKWFGREYRTLYCQTMQAVMAFDISDGSRQPRQKNTGSAVHTFEFNSKAVKIEGRKYQWGAEGLTKQTARGCMHAREPSQRLPTLPARIISIPSARPEKKQRGGFSFEG